MLEPLWTGLKYVAAVGMYVHDVFYKFVIPAIGQELANAFAHLQPYLPTTGGMLKTLGVAADGLQFAFSASVNFLVSRHPRVRVDSVGGV